MLTDSFEIKAKLTLYPTDKGGKGTGIKTGYRPNHVFEYEKGKLKQTYIGQITFNGIERILPGETFIVKVEFLDLFDIRRFISIGRIWWIHEGANRIGEAEIIETNEYIIRGM